MVLVSLYLNTRLESDEPALPNAVVYETSYFCLLYMLDFWMICCLLGFCRGLLVVMICPRNWLFVLETNSNWFDFESSSMATLLSTSCIFFHPVRMANRSHQLPCSSKSCLKHVLLLELRYHLKFSWDFYYRVMIWLKKQRVSLSWSCGLCLIVHLGNSDFSIFYWGAFVTL